MKKPISWHENNLANTKKYYEQKKVNLEREMIALKDIEQDYLQAETTLERAKKEGLTEFDSEKYNKKRKIK